MNPLEPVKPFSCFKLELEVKTEKLNPLLHLLSSSLEISFLFLNKRSPIPNAFLSFSFTRKGDFERKAAYTFPLGLSKLCENIINDEINSPCLN
jgi:hypothetical protein